MNGTMRLATSPMRRMPPTMTAPTASVSTSPLIQCGTPKYVYEMSATFHAWNMLPPVTVETRSVTQKMPPTTRPTGASFGLDAASPRRTTYIGPPCGSLGSDRSRNSIACVTSVILSAMPITPTTHIQKSAPGPPSEIAIATPAMLPRPTVAESAVDSAWKWLIAPGSDLSSNLPRTTETPCVSARY